MSDAGPLAEALSERYRIERQLGQGGMATVYLADDLRNDRQVALKVLRPELAAILGSERFLHEIKTTANLQHPHILPLHDSGEAAGLVYYVMPYVEGESLRDRLRREKQLPVKEAVRIAKEVADALDYAHRHGVIHRDVKPENVLLHDGRALVADFGIALAASRGDGGTRMTESGLSLGTPQYMAPEQAMGEREITPRADIYALGCVLYEMLIGEPPFTGPTAQAIFARAMTEDPRSLVLQRRSIPPNVEATVTTALAKLPADRFESAAEFAKALESPAFAGAAGTPIRAGASPWASWARDGRTLALGSCVLVALAAAATGLRHRLGTDADGVVALSIPVPDSAGGVTQSPGRWSVAISPDDRVVAFGAVQSGKKLLFLRRLDGFDLREIAGGGMGPAFSPDSRAVVFTRDGAIWEALVERPAPFKVATLPEGDWNLLGLLWHPDGMVLALYYDRLWAVPAQGGAARAVLVADTAKGEFFQRMSLLPDRRVLVDRSRGEDRRLIVVDIQGGRARRIAPSGPGQYVAGWFVSPDLTARRFDATAMTFTGEARSIVPPSGQIDETPKVAFSLGGTAAWVSVGSSEREVVMVTPAGVASPLTQLPGGRYRWPRLAPDGERLGIGSRSGVFVFDLKSGARTLLRTGQATEPTWVPGGKLIVTSIEVEDATGRGIAIGPADASRLPDTIHVGHESWPTSVSPDGRLLLCYGAVTGDIGDLFLIDLTTHETRRLPRPGVQRGGRFSPDGRLIAYQSDESGRWEVYLQDWPGLKSRMVISVDGGAEPVWSLDGRELYYRDRDRLMVVSVAAGAGLAVSPPRVLFTGPYLYDPFGDESYDVTRDGRFIMMRPAGKSQFEVRVLTHWLQHLDREPSSKQ